MANYVTITSNKSRKKALFLCTCFGLAGAHRFYVGKTFTGILYACTFGVCFMGWFRDGWKIKRGTFTDNVGTPLRK